MPDVGPSAPLGAPTAPLSGPSNPLLGATVPVVYPCTPLVSQLANLASSSVSPELGHLGNLEGQSGQSLGSLLLANCPSGWSKSECGYLITAASVPLEFARTSAQKDKHPHNTFKVSHPSVSS